jgi:hypothetical protein
MTYDVLLAWQGLSASGFSAIVTGGLLLIAGVVTWVARDRAA